MSDIPISSEHASDKKERSSQEASDLLSGVALPRHPVPSEHELSLRPIPKRDGLSADAERELLLPEIIKKVPDIVYEFARDVVLALSEREHFTPNEIASLRKADVITGGIEIYGRRISEETTTALAVYIGAVRTYLPPGQWKTDDSGLFAVFGEKVGEDRPKNSFARIEDTEKIIREYLDERDSCEEETILTDQEREALRKSPAQLIRLRSSFVDTAYSRQDESVQEEDRIVSNGSITKENLPRKKAIQRNTSSSEQSIESPKRAPVEVVIEQNDTPVIDPSQREKNVENLIAHTDVTRRNLRGLLASCVGEDATISGNIQNELGEIVVALESFFESVGVSSLLMPPQKRGLRYNCELIVVQIRKLLRETSLQDGRDEVSHPAIRHLETDCPSDISFSDKLEAVLHDLRALRKTSSSIL